MVVRYQDIRELCVTRNAQHWSIRQRNFLLTFFNFTLDWVNGAGRGGGLMVARNRGSVDPGIMLPTGLNPDYLFEGLRVASQYQLKYKYFSHICAAKKKNAYAYILSFPSMVIGLAMVSESGIKERNFDYQSIKIVCDYSVSCCLKLLLQFNMLSIGFHIAFKLHLIKKCKTAQEIISLLLSVVSFHP